MSAFQVVPASTGSTAAGTTPTSNDPTNVKLKVSWTKEQLKARRTSSTTRPRRERRTGHLADDRHGAAAAAAAAVAPR